MEWSLVSLLVVLLLPRITELWLVAERSGSSQMFWHQSPSCCITGCLLHFVDIRFSFQNTGSTTATVILPEVIMSKYYGESEQLMGKVFSLAKEIPNGAIIFLDEVDSMATARDSETHETTHSLLSVSLRQIDGFQQDKEVVVAAATNRKQDLDPSLLSLFDSIIAFGLPDHQTHQEIAAQYANHLIKSDLAELASATAEMSDRDIREVCQQAESHWASKKIVSNGAPISKLAKMLDVLTDHFSM